MSNPQQYCLTLNLRDDDELIREYEGYHKPGNVWPEVIDSIRESGILDMRIYRSGLLLIMIMTVSDTFSFENKALRDNGNPRVGEWESLMARFQKADEQSMADEKWQPASEVFALEDHSN
mgnify:CR=1 FL=1|jgi:L-rhamnose mutarotase